MTRTGDYVEKLANNIEDKLDMTSDDIRKMDRKTFKNLLKNAYFSQKYYKEGTEREEPTKRQLDVLELHYKKEIKNK